MPIHFNPRLRRTSRILFFVACVSIASLSSARPAWAMKNRTIVLRATGSGALLGLGAGLVSYPFAKSTNTIVAGVAVGAILGVVYGYYMVDARNRRYEEMALIPEDSPGTNFIPAARSEFWDLARRPGDVLSNVGNLRRQRMSPPWVEWSTVVFEF